MAQNSAQRQAAYRQKHLKEMDGGKERLQAIISAPAKQSLDRLARHHGLTLAALVERLSLEEAARVTAGMDGDQFKRFVGE